MTAPGQAPLLHMAFHSGRATDPEALPLELLMNILVNGDSSRLHRTLVEDLGFAISVGGMSEGGIDPALVYLYLTLPADGDVEAAEAAVMEVLGTVVESGVSDDELEKAKNQMLADYWREVATIDGKASLLGRFEVIDGDYEKLFDLPDRLAALSTESLREVAADVFRRDNVTVGVFVPEAATAVPEE